MFKLCSRNNCLGNEDRNDDSYVTASFTGLLLKGWDLEMNKVVPCGWQNTLIRLQMLTEIGGMFPLNHPFQWDFPLQGYQFYGYHLWKSPNHYYAPQQQQPATPATSHRPRIGRWVSRLCLSGNTSDLFWSHLLCSVLNCLSKRIWVVP